MRLELCRNYATSYVKKTEVEVLPVVDLSGKSAFQIFFFVGDAGDAAQGRQQSERQGPTAMIIVAPLS